MRSGLEMRNCCKSMSGAMYSLIMEEMDCVQSAVGTQSTDTNTYGLRLNATRRISISSSILYSISSALETAFSLPGRASGVSPPCRHHTPTSSFINLTQDNRKYATQSQESRSGLKPSLVRPHFPIQNPSSVFSSNYNRNHKYPTTQQATHFEDPFGCLPTSFLLHKHTRTLSRCLVSNHSIPTRNRL
jgi:hypothetical protein